MGQYRSIGSARGWTGPCEVGRDRETRSWALSGLHGGRGAWFERHTGRQEQQLRYQSEASPIGMRDCGTLGGLVLTLITRVGYIFMPPDPTAASAAYDAHSELTSQSHRRQFEYNSFTAFTENIFRQQVLIACEYLDEIGLNLLINLNFLLESQSAVYCPQKFL